MRELRLASCASSASIRLSAALELELLPEVLAVEPVPVPVVPQAVSAITTAVAAIGRNIIDAPIMIEEVIRSGFLSLVATYVSVTTHLVRS